jgi:hypothetical protein
VRSIINPSEKQAGRMSKAFEIASKQLEKTVHTLEGLTLRPPSTEIDAAYNLGRSANLGALIRIHTQQLEQVMRADMDAAIAAKDSAYTERNQLVACLARLLPGLGYTVGVGQHDPNDLEWEDDWRTIVYFDLPSGQVSWHIHDSEVALFRELPAYTRAWDGHDTPEKYRRLSTIGL